MSRPRKTTPDPAPAARREAVRSRYRKVEVKLWLDEVFMEFEGPAPNPQSLWLYLLTTHRSISIPGVIIGREAVLADDLRWPVEGFRKAFRELEGKGLAVASWPQGLTMLRRALFHSDGSPRETNRPESPNVVTGWFKVWKEVPECALKSSILLDLATYTDALGSSFREAFEKAFEQVLRKPSVLPSDKASRNQYSGFRIQEEEREASPTAIAAPSAPAKTEPLSRTAPSDAERLARRQIAGRIYALQEESRRAIDPQIPSTPKQACEDRIVLALAAGFTEENLLHVLRVYAAEAAAAKRDGAVEPLRYFNGVTPWDPTGGYANATRALSRKPAAAAPIRRQSDDDEWQQGGKAPAPDGVSARAARKAAPQ